MLRYETLPDTPFQQNCSLVGCDRSREAAVVDPGGDRDSLIASITQRLWPMGDDSVFTPGHGPESTFGRERRSSPFVGGT